MGTLTLHWPSILILFHPVDDPNPRAMLRVRELWCPRGNGHMTVRTVYFVVGVINFNTTKNRASGVREVAVSSDTPAVWCSNTV